MQKQTTQGKNTQNCIEEYRGKENKKKILGKYKIKLIVDPTKHYVCLVDLKRQKNNVQPKQYFTFSCNKYTICNAKGSRFIKIKGKTLIEL